MASDLFDGVLGDLRVGLRGLLRRPVLTALVVLTLGLGIGANAAIFSAVRSVLLQSPPFRDPERLVRIDTVGGSGVRDLVSMRELQDLREDTGLFDDIAAYRTGAGYTMSEGAGRPEEPSAILTTGNLFRVLGVELAAGSSWPESYDRERSFGVVLSYELWRRKFDGDPAVVERTIALDAAPYYRVFGVAPRGLDFPARTELFRSININPQNPNLTDRDARNVVGLGRLRAGVSLTEAQQRLDAFSRSLARSYPDTNRNTTIVITPLRELFVGEVRAYLALLSAAVAFVLLIAAVNVANVMLARTHGRRRELAIRSALGAGAWRVARLVLTESLLVAALGGAVGLAVAVSLIGWLEGSVELQLPIWMTIELDAAVLVFTAAMAVVTGIATAALPAARLMSRHRFGTLRSGGRTSADRGHHRLRRALVVAEVALCLVLLTGAGLMLRTLSNLLQEDVGVATDARLTLRVMLPWFKYGAEEQLAFHPQVVERLAALPGVEGVTLTSNLPLWSEADPQRLVIAGESQSTEAIESNPRVRLQIVEPGYFEVMGVPLLAGRGLQLTDRVDDELVAVVGRSVAERLWPGQRAVDRRIRVTGDPEAPWRRVAGIVDDIRHPALVGEAGFDVYLSSRQVPAANVHYVLRTRVPPMSLAQQAAEVVWSLDPDQPVIDVTPLRERLSSQLWRQRMVSGVLSLFATAALLLAAIGIYGVIANHVAERTREIGIRMALGASNSAVVAEVVRTSLRSVGAGLAIGIAASALLAWLMRRFLFGVAPFDPVVFSVLPLVLILVALLASWLPARRAAGVDPALSLSRE